MDSCSGSGNLNQKNVSLSNYGKSKDSNFIRKEVGETYDEKSSIQKEIVVDFFTKTIPKFVKNGNKVLDLGCGTGNTTLKITKYVGEDGFVLGTDIAEGMIKKAKDKETKNLSFDIADCLDFQNVESIKKCGLFDIVFTSYMIHWVENKRKVFQGAHKCLKPDGYFIGTFVVNLSPQSPNNELVNKAADLVLKEETEHLAEYKDHPDTILELMKECGFHNIEYWNIFTPHLEFKGSNEEEIRKKMEDHLDTVITIAADKPEKRKEVLRAISKMSIDVAKTNDHQWSKVLIDGEEVNYYTFEETDDGNYVLRIKVEILEFVVKK